MTRGRKAEQRSFSIKCPICKEVHGETTSTYTKPQLEATYTLDTKGNILLLCGSCFQRFVGRETL